MFRAWLKDVLDRAGTARLDRIRVAPCAPRGPFCSWVHEQEWFAGIIAGVENEFVAQKHLRWEGGERRA